MIAVAGKRGRVGEITHQQQESCHPGKDGEEVGREEEEGELARRQKEETAWKWMARVVAHSRDESGLGWCRKRGAGNSTTRCGCHHQLKPPVPRSNNGATI